MADASVPSATTPHDLLASLRDLTRRVRTEQRGAWFPLLLLGILFAGGVFVSRLTYHFRLVPCPGAVAAPGGCSRVERDAALYWAAGLVAVYLATAVFYIRTSRSRGVGSVVRPYLIAGIAVLLLGASVRLWSAGQAVQPGVQAEVWGLHFHTSSGVAAFLARLTGRALSVGVPLLVLAWVERNRALLLFGLGYLLIELVPLTAPVGGSNPTSPWGMAPELSAAALYLLGGALGFGLARRRGGRPVAR